MGIGIWECLLIFLLVLLVFGAKRLPEIARSMGKAVTEFKKAQNEILNGDPPSGTTTASSQAIHQGEPEEPQPDKQASKKDEDIHSQG